MTTRPFTQARDDQVLAALRSCPQMGTAMEVAGALAGEGTYPQYATAYYSLRRLERLGLVRRCRFEYNANIYWQVTEPALDLSLMEWAQSDGDHG